MDSLIFGFRVSGLFRSSVFGIRIYSDSATYANVHSGPAEPTRYKEFAMALPKIGLLVGHFGDIKASYNHHFWLVAKATNFGDSVSVVNPIGQISYEIKLSAPVDVASSALHFPLSTINQRARHGVHRSKPLERRRSPGKGNSGLRFSLFDANSGGFNRPPAEVL